MSIYADLVCLDCHVRLWLGKVIHENDQPSYYHGGQQDDPPMWQRPELNAVLWKMLADHARHALAVAVEGDDLYDDLDSTTYLTETPDSVGEVGFEDYLRAWPGLNGQRPQRR